MTLEEQILNDIRVEISDEFDRNFERKAFFSKRWKPRKHDGKGTLMMQTGKLRRSIKAKVQGRSVVFSSSEPYAAIHNEGGSITVTNKMKRFFWAKFYECAGRVKHKKSGGVTKSSMRFSEEAEMWRNLALMKAGSKITIPQRQFLGDAPEIHTAVKRIVGERVKDIPAMIKQRLNNH